MEVLDGLHSLKHTLQILTPLVAAVSTQAQGDIIMTAVKEATDAGVVVLV